MTSLFKKAARMNYQPMDFVLQVTVVELVLGKMDDGRVLSFELSRGTKASGLPPKLVSTTRSEWGQTMQVILTLFLDKKSGRFQDKEYKLRLVQRGKDQEIISAPALATFILDASLYAHLGAGPSVEQPVDLYAPKLNGTGGFANVHLKVRCCETGGGVTLGRSASVPGIVDVHRAPSSGPGLPPRGPMSQRRPALTPLQSRTLVGSSFGFSMSGSESRPSGVSNSPEVSSPMLRRPWSSEVMDMKGSSTSARRRRGYRRLKGGFGSKSFNDLDDGDRHSGTAAGNGRGGGRLRSSTLSSFNTSFGSVSSTVESPISASERWKALSTRDTLASASSCFATPGSVANDRTNTVGYNRLVARFAKGPSPKLGRMRVEAPSTSAGVDDKDKGVNGDGVREDATASTNANGGDSNGSSSYVATNGVGLGIVGKRRLSASAKAGAASMIPVEFPVTGGVSMSAPAGAVVSNVAPAPSGAATDTSTILSISAEPQAQAQAPSVGAAEKAPVQAGGSVETRAQQTVLPQEQHHHQRHQQHQHHQRHRQHNVGWSIPSVTGSGRGWAPSRTPRVGPPGGSIGGGGGGAQAGIGNVSMSTAGVVVAPSGLGRQQSEDSAGGGSAVAAPLSSSTAGGGGVGGGGASRSKRKTEEEKLVEMENRVLHLEAALMRSELDLYRAKNELSRLRLEAAEMREKGTKVSEDRPVNSSGDIPALYDALEGSVVLLQIASEKMLHLEQTISKHRSIIPKRVFNELQECVTQDARVLSPVSTLRPQGEQGGEQPR